MGDINAVAQIISMFFMVTYGAICLVSFLEHFAADPAYRPTFKSKWYLSLLGAVACIWLMFKMNFAYAVASIVLMGGIYIMVTYFNKEKKALSKIFQGVIFQVSRNLQLFLQKSNTENQKSDWRPAVICLSKEPFKRIDAFDLLRWVSQKYGFGTYISLIDGYLSRENSAHAKQTVEELIQVTKGTKNKIFFSTIVSPSFTTAIAQVIQLPGITGKPNNTILIEFERKHDTTNSIEDFISNFSLIHAMEFDVFLLSTSSRSFGFKREIDIWITAKDYENANLMILTAFIIMGHEDWKNGEIKLYTIVQDEDLELHKTELTDKIQAGRLPISINNIEILTDDEKVGSKTLINKYSSKADLTIIGFRSEMMKRQGKELFDGYDDLGNILFVNSTTEIELS